MPGADIGLGRGPGGVGAFGPGLRLRMSLGGARAPGRRDHEGQGGRAIDIYLDIKYPQEKALGKLLYAMFKDNSTSWNTGHVIYDGLVWSPGSGADRTTQAAGVRDVHDNHVHVDFDTTNINGAAYHLIGFILAVRFRMDALYKDWMRGYYGTAYDPSSHNTRLSPTERLAIYNSNKGVTPMSLDPAYLKAVNRAVELRAAGLLPDPSGL